MPAPRAGSVADLKQRGDGAFLPVGGVTVSVAHGAISYTINVSIDGSAIEGEDPAAFGQAVGENIREQLRDPAVMDDLAEEIDRAMGKRLRLRRIGMGNAGALP